MYAGTGAEATVVGGGDDHADARVGLQQVLRGRQRVRREQRLRLVELHVAGRVLLDRLARLVDAHARGLLLEEREQRDLGGAVELLVDPLRGFLAHGVAAGLVVVVHAAGDAVERRPVGDHRDARVVRALDGGCDGVVVDRADQERVHAALDPRVDLVDLRGRLALGLRLEDLDAGLLGLFLPALLVGAEERDAAERPADADGGALGAAFAAASPPPPAAPPPPPPSSSPPHAASSADIENGTTRPYFAAFVSSCRRVGEPSGSHSGSETLGLSCITFPHPSRSRRGTADGTAGDPPTRRQRRIPLAIDQTVRISYR